MCTLLKRSKNTSEKRSPLSGRTKLGFSQINPEEFVVLPSGEKAPKEEGLHPGEKGRPTDRGKNGQMDQEVHRPPQRNPPGIPKPVLHARGKEDLESVARRLEAAEKRFCSCFNSMRYALHVLSLSKDALCPPQSAIRNSKFAILSPCSERSVPSLTTPVALQAFPPVL